MIYYSISEDNFFFSLHTCIHIHSLDVVVHGYNRYNIIKPIYIVYIYNIVRRYNAAAKSLQSCPTLCDPIDGSPPGSTVPGILQARTLRPLMAL